MIYSLYPDSGDYKKKLIADFSKNVYSWIDKEIGAYSMAIHPNFIQNGKLYIAYCRNKRTGDVENGALAIEEWKAVCNATE